MNKVHRIVWNEALQMWMAVAENAKGHSKSSRSIVSAKRRLKLAALVAGLVTGSAGLQLAYAAPAGGQVTSGAGTIAQSGQTTTIHQSTQNLSIDWKSFNVGTNEKVNFVQPGSTAIAVNKIFDTNGSQILGHLNANGQIFLINPNGVIFGAGAQVNVGGLVASTLDIASSTGSTTSFAGTGNGKVINFGKITAANGGYVALLGHHVSNQGVISAQLGTVVLGAGTAITLSFNGSNLVRMVVDQSVLNTLVENGGLIQSDGGKVLMTAGAAKSLLASVVNNTGMIEARTLNQQGGTITLLGGMQNGTVNVAGTLDASAPNGGNGGFIETSAARVAVADAAKITTAAAMGLAGTWLIDPTDFTISAGADALTTSGIGALTLGASLGTTNVTIATDALSGGDLGDIHVNAPVTWTANKLTLNAQNNININAHLNGSGTASLALQYGQGAVALNNTSTYSLNNGAQVNLPAGPYFSTLLGSDGVITNYTVITQLGAQTDAATAPATATLQGMALTANLAGNYALGGNIDAAATAAWNTAGAVSAGFTPIGVEYATAFTGKFDGLGHTIANLTINRPNQSNVGLFGASSYAVIQNVGLVGGSVTGSNYVGGLAGYNIGAVSNSYATGSVTGTGENVGGLLGGSWGPITNSYATGSVAGTRFVGGLVGANSGNIVNSHATGSVTGSKYVGGLVGFVQDGAINNSFATGSVIGTDDFVGGLVGYNQSGAINNSFAIGSVSSTGNYVGGLVGRNHATITDSYATGSVTGSNKVGGLVGFNDYATIHNSYASGSVNGSVDVGGLVGEAQYGEIKNSYATGSVNGITYVGGLVGYNYGATVNNSYATGVVTGNNSVGGLVGYNYGATINNSYWNKDTNLIGIGSGDASGATGLSSAQMQSSENFVGFIFTSTPGATGNNWVMVNADGSLNNAGGVLGATTPMLASEYSTRINNAHQLQLMAMDTSASYTLSKNINAAATAGGDVWGSAGFVPVGQNWPNRFTGTFDGLGHTISNLMINRPDQPRVGLFGLTNDAVIQNVGLVGGSVTGSNDVGSLVGYHYGGTINNSYATGSVTGGNNVGGLVGSNYGTITNSYATGSISGTQLVGGLVGYNSGSIGQSYATGSVSGRNDVGGLAGNNMSSTISSSYATGNVTGGSSVGGLVGYNSGAISDSHATGSVTGSSYYVGGLVGTNSSATISNSYATGSVTGINNVGGLAGINNYGGTISYSHATGSVNGNNNVGGLVGYYFYGAVNDSYATGSVSGSGSYVGGLVGYNYGATISKSYATGSVSGSSYVGGLVGYALSAEISNSYATGSVVGSVSGGNYVGGLVGYAQYGAINNSYATGSVTGGNNVGGLVGYSPFSEINNSHATGNVTGGGSVGGLVGNSGSATISNVYATGNVTGTGSSVGGLVGYNSGAISNSYATGSVTGNDSVGGLAGINSGRTISNNYATGSVNGNNNVGGLVGYSFYGGVNNSYATGSVSGGGSYVGGLVGYNYGATIGNSYATGIVNGIYSVGGLVGHNFFGAINNSYWNSDIHSVGIGSNDNVGDTIGAAGLTTSQMMQASSFAGWNIANTGGSGAIWRIYEGHTSPLLTSFLTPLTLADAPDASVTYNGLAQSGLSTVNPLVLGAAATGKNAAFYTGHYSTQQGYDITGGNLTINKATLALSGTKVYDGTTTLPGANLMATGVNGQTFAVTGTGATALTTARVQTSQSLANVTYLALGAGNTGEATAANYNALSTAGSTVSVTPATLPVTGLSAANKVYDAGTAATLSGTATVTALGSDVVSLTGTASGTFVDKNVGTTKTVATTGVGLSGADAGNYTLVQQSLTANITPATLPVTGLSAANKSYDAGTAATLSGTPSVTALGSDAVSLTGTASGTFADKNVGTAKTVATAGVSLGGADAGNYTLVQQSLTANITPATLPVTGLSAANKVYDANTAATLSGTPSVTALGSDVVSLTGTASGTFADKNVGTTKTVATSGVSLSGADSGNYTLVQQSLTANITPATLPVTGLSAANKVYDASTAATLSGTPSVTALGSDAVSLTGTATGTFADKNVGTAKTVATTGVGLSGADAGNYTLVQQALTANITPATLPVTGLSAANKAYDANTAATLSGTPSVTALGSDAVSLTGTATGTFADKNVGTAKTVATTGVGLSGTDAGNYTLVQQALTANITPATLPVTGLSAANKVYDANTAATLSGTATVTALGSDAVSLIGTATGSFSDKNVGTAKTVATTGVGLSGADAGNYTLVQQALTANITPATLPVTGLSAANKAYDASTAATLSGTPSVTALGSDVVSLTGTASGTFADKNVGTAKTVATAGVSLSGADAGNYTLVQQALTANITPATLPVTGLSAANKVYDANTAATLSGTPSVAALGSDAVSLTGTASGTFADKNVGTAKTVATTGVSLSGADAGNYTLVQQSLTANITPATLPVTGLSAANKVYDAGTAATLSGTPSVTALGSDVVSLTGTATGTFSDKNVGTAKPVATTGVGLSGADAGNYTLVQQALTSV
jgi:filamentous hemagglutinin family protein